MIWYFLLNFRLIRRPDPTPRNAGSKPETQKHEDGIFQLKAVPAPRVQEWPKYAVS
jgi:hypothetical protein